MKKIVNILEKFVFLSRWILVFMYAALAFDLLCYASGFALRIFHIHIFDSLLPSAKDYTFIIIEHVDNLMIGNLIVMILIGGWHIFLRKMIFKDATDKPQWLDHINAGGLKVKMSMSLAGVACVYLLKYFIETDVFYHKIIIAVLYLIAGYVFAKTDNVLHPERVLALKEEQKNNISTKDESVKGEVMNKTSH